MSWRRNRHPLLVAICWAAAATAASAQTTETLTYRIEHETWGEIGRFSNTIHRDGGRTEVEARLRIAVTILFGGIVLYREQADRLETWENGRLRAYQSTTDVDGDEIRISGRAEGEGFVIQRPDGEVTAPPDIFPTNLWTIGMKDARTVMGTKSGALVPVEVTEGGRHRIEIDGRTVETRRYEITPRADPSGVPFPQEGWFDDVGVPVRFAVVKDGKRVVFTMTNYPDVVSGRAGAQ